MAHACEAGHEISEASHKRGGPCSACRIAAVAHRVATADPTLDGDLIIQAIEAVITSPAALRDLHAALAGGPEALIAGAPAVVEAYECPTCCWTNRGSTPSSIR